MKYLTLALTASVMLAGPVLAQQQHQYDYSRGVDPRAAREAMEQRAFTRQTFDQNMATSALDRQLENTRDTLNPRRVRRAQEAAELINAGDCPGALALATAARDQRLVTRINQVCAQIGVSDPVPVGG